MQFLTLFRFRSAAIFSGALACLLATPGWAQPNKVKTNPHAHGAAAIAALGEHLPDVAKAYGLDRDGLENLFNTQPSLAVDADGALLFVCAGLAVTPEDALADGALTAGATTATSSSTTPSSGAAPDAFHLHSLPGAKRLIYLDFNGFTTSGTSWNSAYAGGADIVSQPFDLDGDPTTFSATEQAFIQRVWQRVSEDYAPFSVDVTTEDPGAEGLRYSGTSDLSYGTRVVVSPTNWYNPGNGGVAYVGSFNWTTNTPCFVFTQQLQNGEKYIAEACAHETGHTLGLYHDGLGGTAPTEYYQGQGNWAPIMGNSYYRAVSQFSKGEYANANNLQDDLAVIATFVPLMTDDHGNTLATASVLAGPNVADGGTIASRTDLDLFRFDTGAGAISLSIQDPAPEPDLDIKAELLNSAGQVIYTSDDPNSLGASINATLAAGTYYLRISGVGSGDPVTTGYSNYASIGNYVITGTLISNGTKQAPVAVATASTVSGTAALTVNFFGQSSTDSDGTIVSYQWDFGNGVTSSAVNPSCTYTTPGSFNATLTVTDNDGLVGTAAVAINVTAPADLAPVAVATANTTSGSTPLPITFSGSSSYDPDGTIASYSWDFGDGTTSAVASPSKTYMKAGSYTARLTVTDNQGVKSSASVPVSVTSDGSTDIDVSSFTLTTSTANSGTGATATVVVLDRGGHPAAGVTVSIKWSGPISGTTSGKTDATGKVQLASPRSKKKGVVTATLTVTPPTGINYDSTINSTATVKTVTF